MSLSHALPICLRTFPQNDPKQCVPVIGGHLESIAAHMGRHIFVKKKIFEIEKPRFYQRSTFFFFTKLIEKSPPPVKNLFVKEVKESKTACWTCTCLTKQAVWVSTICQIFPFWGGQYLECHFTHFWKVPARRASKKVPDILERSALREQSLFHFGKTLS